MTNPINEHSFKKMLVYLVVPAGGKVTFLSNSRSVYNLLSLIIFITDVRIMIGIYIFVDRSKEACMESMG